MLARVVTLVLGILTVIGATVTLLMYDDLYHSIMAKKLVISEGSFSYDMWKKTPIPLYMKIYYFNCTNHEDMVRDPVNNKPLLKQVGPYVFREEHEKTNISFTDDFTVKFNQRKFWYFEEERSTGSLDDEIYTLNMIALAAAEVTRWPNSFAEGDYPFMRYVMNTTFYQDDEHLFTKARIGNLTFEGIDSDLLHMGDIGGMLGDAIEENVPFDRFGWFYSRNGSDDYDGRYEMYTGEDDIYQVGQISSWEDMTDMSSFYPAPCNQLSGSAGEFFPQDRDKTSISYFTPDLCRPINFNFKEKTKVRGVSGYKYWLDDMFFGNSSVNSTNSCFNPQPDLVPDMIDWTGKRNSTLAAIDGAVNLHLPSGLLNVSTCKFDSPAYVSLPHFYMADPSLLDQFHPDSDLNPNEADHESYLSLMPKQGIPLDVAIRLQINILYRPLDLVDMLSNVKPTYYPAVWFETTTELTDDLVSQMRLLQWVPYFGNIIGYSSLGIGIVLITTSLFLFFKTRIFLPV